MDPAHPSVPSNSPPRTRMPLTPAAASTSTGDASTSTSTWVTNPVPEPISNNINTSIKLNTHNIPPQFLSGGGGGGENSSADFGSSNAGAGADNSPTSSPRGAFASNYSLKSELENIRLEDHCFVDGGHNPIPDDYPDPDNINLGSLMARMRQIRSSGQIQYRIPKKRRREDEPKTCREGEELEEELETITIQRQKRVRKNPRGPRSERDKARKKRNETRNETGNETGNEKRNWLLKPACHPPMVLETVPEVEMEVAPELDNVRSGGGETGDEGTKLAAD